MFRRFTEYFKDLLDREYFRRFWCIQEVLYAQKCDIQCGTEEMDFRDLMALALLIQHWLHDRQRCTVQFWIHLTRVKASRTMPIQHTWRTDDAPFLGAPITVMRATRYFQYTDPRDRVYALFHTFQTSIEHSLAKIDPEMSGEGPTIERLVEPNYSKKVNRVYRDFCWACVTFAGPKFKGSGEPLEFLSSVQHLDAEESKLPTKWPSWVPNFHSGTDVLSFQTSLWSAGVLLNGCNSHLPTSSWRSENILRVWGFEVDTVEARTKVLDPTPTSDWMSAAWSELFSIPLFPKPSLRTPYGHSTMPLATDAAFLLTLVAGKQGGYGDWLSETNEMNMILYSDLAREQQATLRGTDSAKRYCERAAEISRQRCCYLTKGGRLGLGPSIIKKGDRVVVLTHGRIPYILRQMKRQGSWKFIGDTYVQDEVLMRGQGMRFTAGSYHFSTLFGSKSFATGTTMRKFKLV